MKENENYRVVIFRLTREISDISDIEDKTKY